MRGSIVVRPNKKYGGYAAYGRLKTGEVVMVQGKNHIAAFQRLAEIVGK